MNNPSSHIEQNATHQEDKRQSARFPMRAYAEIKYSTKSWNAHILDLSATGARLALLDEHLLQKGDVLRVHILLEDITLNSDKKQLHLHGSIVHVREHIVGYKFQPDAPADKELLEQLILFLSDPG